MTYDPSTIGGVKSIQVDLNGATLVSDDITTHSQTTFTSSSVYFIEDRSVITTDTSSAGRIIYTSLTGFAFMGGVNRSNAVTGINTITDAIFCGVNTRNTALANVQTTQGSGNITRFAIRSYWRIL